MIAIVDVLRIEDCIKKIDNHIANNPLEKTLLPEARHYLYQSVNYIAELQEKLSHKETCCNNYLETLINKDKDINTLTDKLHRRNLQIADLKKKLNDQDGILFYVCKNAEVNIMSRDKQDSNDKQALRFIDRIVNQ